MVKKDVEGEQTLEWILHVKHYLLRLDKHRCAGCQMCSLACPKEAIRLEKQPARPEEKARKANVDVDLAKCNFCGICDVMCPYGAVKVTVNGEHALPIVEKESFPRLVRDIQVDAGKYRENREACPLGLIKVGPPDETSKEPSPDGKGQVDVDREHCPCCRICEFKLPEGAMRVRKFAEGKICIHREKCPPGCTACLDVCPLTGVLFLSDGGKVGVNEPFCVYCGACKVVCPVEDALELRRTRLDHTPVKSGAWNKALERVTSTIELSKELGAKSRFRTRSAVGKLLGGDKND